MRMHLAFQTSLVVNARLLDVCMTTHILAERVFTLAVRRTLSDTFYR